MIRRILSIGLLMLATPALATPDGAALYAEHCASCHAESRLGGTGPALIPQTLRRMFGPKLEKVITQGRAATQMPAFGDTLSDEEIAAIAAYLAQPLAEIPSWTAEDIGGTRAMAEDYAPAASPVFKADPMNITLVVETGDSHVSVLDGDTFEVLDRFPTPFAVHGGPKFTPDGHFVFVMSRDGWVQKYDIWSLAEVGRVRAGLNSRNIAISGDGKWLAVANYLPMTLTILATEDLSVAKVIDVTGKDGTPSRVSAVYQAPPRESWILALKDIPEVWEVFYGPNPPICGYHSRSPVRRPADHAGPVPGAQDQGEGQARRLLLRPDLRVPDRRLARDPNRPGHRPGDQDESRPISTCPACRISALGSPWKWGDKTVMATPHLRGSMISIIDMENWKTIKQLKTLGPGFFMRSHKNSRYAWADVFFGPNRDVMHIIDKETLEIVKTLRPEPGATVAHTEFTKDGSHALVSIWEDDGAVIVYDAKTLQEVRRLPMRKPSGKYNIWNKITFEEGTSH